MRLRIRRSAGNRACCMIKKDRYKQQRERSFTLASPSLQPLSHPCFSLVCYLVTSPSRTKRIALRGFAIASVSCIAASTFRFLYCISPHLLSSLLCQFRLHLYARALATHSSHTDSLNIAIIEAQCAILPAIVSDYEKSLKS
jgi:hypothetical protein